MVSSLSATAGLQVSGLGLDLVEGIAHRREIGVTRLGQFGAPCVALEELKAQLLFQRLDLVADGGAGDAEFSRRKPERTQPGGGFEGSQGAQGRQISTGQVIHQSRNAALITY